MQKIFKYDRPDGMTGWFTLLWLMVIAGTILLILQHVGIGGYLTAWAVSLIAAVVLLCVLSIPRKIELTDSALEIKCIVEITRIPYGNIKRVRALERGELRGTLPLLAGVGFFGYYGWFIDTRKWDIVRLYCTRWRGLVEITDIFEKRYIVNSSVARQLIDQIEEVVRESSIK